MAGKDSANKQPESTRAKDQTDKDADGYRPTRRQELRREQERQSREKAQKAEAEKQKLTKFQAFMEAHWESWLRPVMLLSLLGLGFLGYTWHILSESLTGTLVAAGVVGFTIYGTAGEVFNLIAERKHRILFGVLVALWAFSSGVPTVRKLSPRKVVGEAVITAETKVVKVKVKGATGPFDLTVSGKIKPTGGQQVKVPYTITVAGGGGQVTVEGDLEQMTYQTRMRRGSSHWMEQHDQIVHRLPGSVTGSELTLSVDSIDELLEDGLHTLVHPEDLLMRLLQPEISGVEVPVLGILVVLIMIFLETRLGDAKEKTQLTMASMVTLIFAYRFHQRATSANLLRPAVEAFILAMVVGGIGGTFLGWLARHLSGRSKVKPRPESTKARDDD